ncbi:MAG: efflux RND transporter periplasmic adaptor subunit [Proteobacteria bacterium]|nr:efflux RND transporter periplasmic adaptor subunit [Pseudomonadota bacterium]
MFENNISTFGTAIPFQTQAYKVEKFEIVDEIKFNTKVKKGDLIVQLKNRKIVAPFDGVIGKKEFSEDVEVSKSSILINLDDASIIYCDVKVPEIYVPFIEVGLPVKIQYSGSNKKIFEGEVQSISSRITEDTRSLPIRIKIDNEKGEILPGSFLEISIRYNVRNNLGAPDTSTIVEGDNVFIYKVDEENKAIKTKVNIGDRYNGFVEIIEGISSGDKIVAEGLKKVRPNGKIKPLEKGAQQESSNWKKKSKPKKDEQKKGKFDWLKKLNIFKKSEAEKK